MSGRAATTSIIPGRYAVSVGRADMPSPPGWQWTLLTDIARLETGHTPSRRHPEYWDGGDIAWIGIKDARWHHGRTIHETIQEVTQLGLDNSASQLLPAGTVCLSRTASVGYVLVMGRDMATSQDFVNWVCTDALQPEFLMYALMAEGEGIRRFGKGTTHTTIYFPEVKAFHLCVPPVNEQRRIVAKIEELFSDLDAGVAALERAKGNLKRYRAAVLKAAVEGKLTAAWRAENPSTESASDLLQRILHERRQKWEQQQLAAYEVKGKKPPRGWRDKYKEPAEPDATDLPKLPDDWCWATVEQLLVENSCNGISVKGSDRPPGIPALKLSALKGRGFDYDDRRYIPIPEATANKRAIREGDFYASRGNGSLHLVGRGSLAQKPPERIVFPDTMIRLRFADIGSIRKLIAVFWDSRLVRRQIERRARTTAGIYKISQRDIDSFVVPLPPVDEQQVLLSLVDEQFAAIDKTEEIAAVDLKRATRLRQSILKRAFEGKLVPQDPTDEPASELLARIKAEREPLKPLGRPKKSRKQSMRGRK